MASTDPEPSDPSAELPSGSCDGRSACWLHLMADQPPESFNIRIDYVDSWDE